MCRTRRAEYGESCSLGSTEAHRRNPLSVRDTMSRTSRRVIPVFYPMHSVAPSEGDAENPRPKFWSRASRFKAGEGAARAVILHRGFVSVLCGTFNRGRRGELPTWQQAEPGRDWLGVGRKSSAVKSSTMKGGQPLAGELKERRCQTAKTQCLWVRSGFCVRAPEIAHIRNIANERKLGRLERRTQSIGVLGVTSDSNATLLTKSLINAGRSAAAGVVAGAWLSTR